MHAIKLNNGGVWILQLTDEEASAEDEIAKWDASQLELIASHREISKSDLPHNRAFRNAWTDDNPTQTVDIDLEKAKVIHMERVKAARNEQLKILDNESMKYLTNPTELARVEQEKQVLRDIPQNLDIDKLDTKNPVKSWPSELELPREYK